MGEGGELLYGGNSVSERLRMGVGLHRVTL